MDHVLRRQPISARDLGRPGRATAKSHAFGFEVGSRSPMDGSINASTTAQGRIGRIDDGIDLKRCDIRYKNLELDAFDFDTQHRHCSCHRSEALKG
jgi:hypothetical protein